jgi:hypothetical protein
MIKMMLGLVDWATEFAGFCNRAKPKTITKSINLIAVFIANLRLDESYLLVEITIPSG